MALPAVTVFLVAMALYVPTLLPDVGLWDTAEFQTVGPVLGIAHPTGYPTWTLLAWLASVILQPFGNEAYRADLLSALLVAGAGALTAVLATRLTNRPLLGALAGGVFVITPVAWAVAVRADAHALHAFFAALLLVMLVEWRRGLDDRWLVAAAIAYGLSLGNHALTLLLMPGVAVFVMLVSPRILWRQPRLVVACLAAIAGTVIVVYAYIPLRSSMQPPLDYAEPRTWEGFWFLVLGEQFRGSIRALPGPLEIVARVWAELVRNIGPLVMLVPASLVLGLVRHARFVALTALWLVATWLFALGYANAVIERYYLVPLLVASVWVALALDLAWDALTGLLGPGRDTAGRRPWVRRAAAASLGVVLVGVMIAPLADRSEELDRSDSRYGRVWLEAMYEALEPDAVVVSWWSFSTPLWYGRWVEGRRPDVTIIDDRDVLDDGYGTALAVVERFLDERPVYIVRRSGDLPRFEARFVLEAVESVPGPGNLHRVLKARPDVASAPA